MEKIQKGHKKHFVDTNFFYKLNQKFFIVVILFSLFQAMVYNACSDIPNLFLLLLMFAFYAYRKVYTRQFLQFTFLVVYFIQFILTIKIINDILTKIEFAQTFMADNKDSNFVKANQIIFGASPQRGTK